MVYVNFPLDYALLNKQKSKIQKGHILIFGIRECPKIIVLDLDLTSKHNDSQKSMQFWARNERSMQVQ